MNILQLFILNMTLLTQHSIPYYILQILCTILILFLAYRFNRSIWAYLFLFSALIACWIIIKSVNPREIRVSAMIYDLRAEDIIFIIGGIILSLMSRKRKIFKKDPFKQEVRKF